MNCIEEQIDLPLATNATREGPIVELRGASLTVKYDCEDDRGGVSWVDVNFEEVLAGAGKVRARRKVLFCDRNQTFKVSCALTKSNTCSSLTRLLRRAAFIGSLVRSCPN